MILKNPYAALKILAFTAIILIIGTNNKSYAQDFNCSDCHEISIDKSVHKDAIDCQGCHDDVTDEEHMEKGVKKVDCGTCHDDKTSAVQSDVHHRLKVKNPPSCISCHGNHEIKKPPVTNSQKVKEYCSKCHTSKTLANPYHSVVTSKNKCLSCHKNVDTKLTLPSSVHKNLECADCHNYISNNLTNHPKNVGATQKADCYLCHNEIAKEHRESIHGISLSEGIDEAAMCWNCHGSHDIKHVKSESSKVHPKNIAETCGKCHDNPKLAKKFNLAMPEPGKTYSKSIHGVLVSKGRTDAPNCSTCHGTHNIKNKVQPGSTISAYNVPQTCGTCHKEIVEDYEQSIHWIRAKKGFREAPVCNDCHSEHSIHTISNGNKREEIKKIQEKTCIACHENPRISERFGKNSEQAKLYQDSYHGLAVMRGDKDAAMCVDCHSVHKILPQEHPASSINPANVTETCKKCHPEAAPVFAQSYSHVTQNKLAAKIEDIVTTIYFWLIISVIGGMILHNVLIFVYEIKKKRKHQQREIAIPRFTKNEVVQHLILLVSFLTLAITGFALKFHDSWWSELLQFFGMTETVRQNIHRTAAVVMIVSGAYHIFYLIFTARGRDVLFNMLPKFSDLIEARDNILYYLKLKETKPKFDKYDYTEKAEYWALIWGTIVMGVTGFILWFPTVVGDWAPVWLIKVSELIHFYEAILATLAILVWHWFFVIFHPHEYPMSLTWIDGKMTLKNYRHHHEKHFRKVVLEWKEFKAEKRTLKKLSNSTLLFTSTLEKNGLDPDLIIDSELNNDLELRSWLDKKLNPVTEENGTENQKK
ncbi:MAG: cytochrome b/b6 domain-containing protein [Ignavibacteriales bacterium]|nr:cytochrome b/b6 domain-containing protein [Ignavibacteriales bacterium]